MSAKRRKQSKRQWQQLLGVAFVLLAVALGCFFPELFGGDGPSPAAPPVQDASAAAPPQSPAKTEGGIPAGSRLYFIDVGQGDASLIESGGEYVLIDGGPGSAEAGLVAYLESLGIERFRAVIATHPHEDHIGGLDKVLARFPADAFYMPDREATTVCFEKMLDAVDAQVLAITIPEPGDALTFGDASLEFLSPDPDAEYVDTNDYSIVTRLTLGDVTVLYMGDAEKVVEDELLASGADLRCDWIKLGHHGSSTSSSRAFIEAASPAAAIISCALENDYGHPHAETLETMDALGITALYTYNGTIVLPEDAA